MITFILLFFGAVFIYTGILVFDRDGTASAAAAIIGILMLAKPAMEGYRRLRAQYPSSSQFTRTRTKPRKPHLKIVEPKDKKPTIH